MIRYFATSEVDEESLEEDGTTASTLSYEYKTINSQKFHFGSIDQGISNNDNDGNFNYGNAINEINLLKKSHTGEGYTETEALDPEEAYKKKGTNISFREFD